MKIMHLNCIFVQIVDDKAFLISHLRFATQIKWSFAKNDENECPASVNKTTLTVEIDT